MALRGLNPSKGESGCLESKPAGPKAGKVSVPPFQRGAGSRGRAPVARRNGRNTFPKDAFYFGSTFLFARKKERWKPCAPCRGRHPGRGAAGLFIETAPSRTPGTHSAPSAKVKPPQGAGTAPSPNGPLRVPSGTSASQKARFGAQPSEARLLARRWSDTGGTPVEKEERYEEKRVLRQKILAPSASVVSFSFPRRQHIGAKDSIPGNRSFPSAVCLAVGPSACLPMVSDRWLFTKALPLGGKTAPK